MKSDVNKPVKPCINLHLLGQLHFSIWKYFRNLPLIPSTTRIVLWVEEWSPCKRMIYRYKTFLHYQAGIIIAWYTNNTRHSCQKRSCFWKSSSTTCSTGSEAKLYPKLQVLSVYFLKSIIFSMRIKQKICQEKAFLFNCSIQGWQKLWVASSITGPSEEIIAPNFLAIARICWVDLSAWSRRALENCLWEGAS